MEATADGEVESFSQWLSTVGPSEIQPWADQLIQLGVSWHSFKHRSPDDVASDLAAHGIHSKASRDIVAIVTKEIIRKEAPMAIFWDLENMPVPVNQWGTDVAKRLKSNLSPYGRLVQFKAYAPTDLRAMPQLTRSQLSLAACHVVDCPENASKEVHLADKMIIVDAMQFAYEHPQGATLCFVTCDVDYAYMLSVLKQREQWRAIIVSRGDLEYTDEAYCDVSLDWENDILQLNSSAVARSTTLQTTTHIKSASLDGTHEVVRSITEPLSAGEVGLLQATMRTMTPADPASRPGEILKSTVGTTLRINYPSLFPDRDSLQLFLARAIGTGVLTERGDGAVKTVSFPSLTSSNNDRITSEDEEILRSVFQYLPYAPGSLPHRGGASHDHYVLKSNLGSTLRLTYPTRFPTRETVQYFLAKALASGVLIEMGDGGSKILCLRDSSSFTGNPTTTASGTNVQGPLTAFNAPKNSIRFQWVLSESPPIPLNEIPQRVHDMTGPLPFALFVRWSRCPKGNQFPNYVFVQNAGEWAIVMFRTIQDAERAVEALPWLRFGTLLDCQRLSNRGGGPPPGFSCSIPPPRSLDRVGSVISNATSAATSAEEQLLDSSPFDRAVAIPRVVELMMIMAVSDDIYVAENIVRKQLMVRYPNSCVSAPLASLWIHSAIEAGQVISFKREGGNHKTKLVCLPSNYQDAIAPFPPDSLDTTQEESFVVDFLWKNQGWIRKSQLTLELKEQFVSMQKPLWRKKLYLNGEAKRLFFIGKRHYGQAVALGSKEDAEKAMDLIAQEEELEEQLLDQRQQEDAESFASMVGPTYQGVNTRRSTSPEDPEGSSSSATEDSTFFRLENLECLDLNNHHSNDKHQDRTIDGTAKQIHNNGWDLW